MYSGTTLNKKSGRFLGVHQKIDRIARKHLQPHLPGGITFPSSRQILSFEGKDGPDGIKRKSPAIDEPWHFINPEHVKGSPLLQVINEHRSNLAKALAEGSDERAAFEAAWMAHAVTDGLTPAHHFPLEEMLKELRGGQGLEGRSSIAKKNVMTGSTKVELIRNNWKYWGTKGAMTSHLAFEAGVASVVAYKRFNDGAPTDEDINALEKEGFEVLFEDAVRRVAALRMYERFAVSGWTVPLARQTNRVLLPLIIRTVVLGWLSASWEAKARQEEGL